MVAQNTREGQVLERLLTKLQIIREQMGDDRVFDVISDIFVDVNLEDVIHSTFDGDATNYDTVIEHELTQENVEKRSRNNEIRLVTVMWIIFEQKN